MSVANAKNGFFYVLNELVDRKSSLKRTLTVIFKQCKQKPKTGHKLCLNQKPLSALYLAYNFTTDNPILIDH